MDRQTCQVFLTGRVRVHMAAVRPPGASEDTTWGRSGGRGGEGVEVGVGGGLGIRERVYEL